MDHHDRPRRGLMRTTNERNPSMEHHHFPDGITEADVDTLLAQVDASVEPIHRPVSPFAMYELDKRRERRAMARDLGARVRVLPVFRPVVVRGEAA
jgi:hypothetical protein